MASITSIHLPRSRSAVFRSLFRGRKFLKLLKRLTVGQAVPEIPLSVGSKLELLFRAFVFANFPYTSPYTHAFVRLSMHDRGAEHFIATLGAHAQEGYCTCPVCLCVSVSVCLLRLFRLHRSFLRSNPDT